jgi:hypothetical protein
MPQQNKNNTFNLTPSWKQFFWGYVLSILFIPVFGIGLILLYFIRKKHQQMRYEISDNRISRFDAKYKHNVDLVGIKDVSVQRSWLQQKLGIGDLILNTSASKMVLAGLDEPEQLKDILEKAIKSEIKQHEEHQKTKAREPQYQPGSMEKMDYLTGLWQQGLISDADYQKERKHFE